MGGVEIETTTLDVEALSDERKKKNGEMGICLTWKDLWVKASSGKKKNGSTTILGGLTGYAKPGQLLAIMGPSGSGKSTLLDALAGRLSSNTMQTGEILINGHKQALAYGTSAYVTQDDTLYTTLTVREAVYYSAQLQLPDSMSKQEKKERAELTIREMGLQDAMNTRIGGGWGSKGISGGQKRRVSICIEILTRPRLLFLDEPTSGLDSAASYYVMRAIASLDHKDGIQRTIIASIHQPSSDVFQLFHNLCLLSSGTTVYFGPASSASELFASNGFPCPTLQNPSDHYLKTINKDFDQDIEQDISAGTQRIPTEEAIHILVNSFKSSEMNQQVQAQVALLSAKESSSMEKKRKGHAGFFTQCVVLTKRSSVNMCRDLGYYWLRLLIYMALALSLATVFHNLGTTYGSIQDRGSFLAFVSSFFTFMAIGGFPSFVEDLKVFERERLNGHYGVTAYVIGNTLSSIPYLLLVSFIPGAISYYLPGLQRSLPHFFYFCCVLFSCLMPVEGLMMIVASIVPNFLMGILLYPTYYLAFHRYAYQGLYKNEYEGLNFAGDDHSSSKSVSGEEVLRSKWEVDMRYSKWVDVGIMLGMIVLYRVIFLVIIKSIEKVKPLVANSLRFVHPKRAMQVMGELNLMLILYMCI
ncbi:ABC transporter G family member 11-like [Senna tora]|uniref:ABC transporter G family member 11-like n=1 Tax=Senna tora TaxID=362788 RepID=A0A834XET7_9FABA|nr:ABC transporter G family member 11-like [Senna tora]